MQKWPFKNHFQKYGSLFSKIFCHSFLFVVLMCVFCLLIVTINRQQKGVIL